MIKTTKAILSVVTAAALLLSLLCVAPVAAAEGYTYLPIEDFESSQEVPAYITNRRNYETDNTLSIIDSSEYGAKTGQCLHWFSGGGSVSAVRLIVGEGGVAIPTGAVGVRYNMYSVSTGTPRMMTAYASKSWPYDGEPRLATVSVSGLASKQWVSVEHVFAEGAQEFAQLRQLFFLSDAAGANRIYLYDDFEWVIDPAAAAPADEGTLSLGLNNSAIDVSVDSVDSTVNENTTEAVKNGAAVTLTAQVSSNDFLFWAEDGKIRSETPQYSFRMQGARNIDAVFSPVTGSIVVYRNDTPDTKQVVAYETYQSAENFTAHLAANANIYGKTFTGWDKSVDDIKALIGTQSVIEVKPVYTDDEERYTVSVQGGTVIAGEQQSYLFGDKLTVSTDLEGFGYWADDTGAVISTDATFVYTVSTRNTVLTAVAQAVPTAFSSLAVENDDSRNTLKIYHSFYLPDDCELIDAGLIYTKSMLDTDITLADVDGSTIKATHLGAGGGNSQTVMNTIAMIGSGVTLRGYVTYINALGETETMYSSTVVPEYYA